MICGNELCSHRECATIRRDKRRAEWRLNEAAPTLLEAARAVCKDAEYIDGKKDDCEDSAIVNPKLLEALEAAIEKATKVRP